MEAEDQEADLGQSKLDEGILEQEISKYRVQ